MLGHEALLRIIPSWVGGVSWIGLLRGRAGKKASRPSFGNEQDPMEHSDCWPRPRPIRNDAAKSIPPL